MGATTKKKPQEFKVKCSRNNCDSGLPPTHTPTLELFDAFGEKLQLVKLQGLIACENCANAYSEPNEFVSDAMWESLCTQIRAKQLPTPSRKLTKVAWSKLNDITPEFLAQFTMELHKIIGGTLDMHAIAPSQENAKEIAAAMLAVGISFCRVAGVPASEFASSLRSVADTMTAAIADDAPVPCLAITENEGNGYACTKLKGHEDHGDLEHACEVVDIGGTLRVEHRWVGDSPSPAQAVEA